MAEKSRLLVSPQTRQQRSWSSFTMSCCSLLCFALKRSRRACLLVLRPANHKPPQSSNHGRGVRLHQKPSSTSDYVRFNLLAAWEDPFHEAVSLVAALHVKEQILVPKQG
eukprot:scaffold48_cov311-Pinguiococcus_pyrenoidosus.AAC.118